MFLRLLLLCLLHTILCRGQSLIGSSQPIVATVGEDVILPCAFNPPRDVAGFTLEWTRPDLDPRFVYVWRSHEELTYVKNKDFKNRTFLFTEELKNGNISLKLTNVKLSDEGTYRCFLPEQGIETSVKLNVGSSSPPVVSVSSVDVWRSAVVLQCDSGAWYPEPELLWLDSEGRLLSAERTHTHTRPDGLYNVSSRVTVEQSSTFTCRVSQSSTNITTQTSVQIQENVFTVNFRLIIICLSVTLAALFFGIIIGIVFIVVFIRKKRKYRKHVTEEKELLMTELDQNKDSSNKKITALQQENENLKSEVDSSKTKITSLNQEIENLKNSSNKKITELEKENERLKTKVITKLQQENGSLKTDLDSSNKKITKLEKENERLMTKQADVERVTEQKEPLKTELELRKEPQEEKRTNEINVKKSTIIIDSVDPKGTSVRLRNTTNATPQQMKDCTVKIEAVNGESYKFSNTFHLKPQSTLTIWAEGCCPTSDSPDPLNTDLEWKNQAPWNKGQRVTVSIYNHKKQLMDSGVWSAFLPSHQEVNTSDHPREST